MACLANLDRRGIGYERVQDFHSPEGCGIDGAVRVNRTSIPWKSPLLMTCQMALTIADLEAQVIQPAAKKHLGKAVVTIDSAGTYACRGEVGGRPERLSEHAFGKAIDITGFEIEGGDRVTVLRDWKDKGAKGKFLREVAEGACRLFKVVLGPAANIYHRDHFHLDIGPYKLCRA